MLCGVITMQKLVSAKLKFQININCNLRDWYLPGEAVENHTKTVRKIII
jgi:hypothetical protein